MAISLPEPVRARQSKIEESAFAFAQRFSNVRELLRLGLKALGSFKEFQNQCCERHRNTDAGRNGQNDLAIRVAQRGALP